MWRAETASASGVNSSCRIPRGPPSIIHDSVDVDPSDAPLHGDPVHVHPGHSRRSPRKLDVKRNYGALSRIFPGALIHGKRSSPGWCWRLPLKSLGHTIHVPPR